MVEHLQDLIQAVDPLSMKFSEQLILMVEFYLELGDLNPSGAKVVTVPPVGKSLALLSFCPVAKMPQGVGFGADVKDKNPSGREKGMDPLKNPLYLLFLH